MVTSILKGAKVTALPTRLEASTYYAVQGAGDTFLLYLTDKNGAVASALTVDATELPQSVLDSLALADSAVQSGDLATVATTGAYSDLSGLPALFDGAYSSLTGVPSTFAPSAHTHAASAVTSGTFDDARISETSVTQHEAAITITEGQISDLGSYLTSVAWGDVTGKPATFPPSAHTHAWSTITAKPTTLSGFGITDAATSAQGANADTAFGWGDHASEGYLTSVGWADVTGKPTFATVATTGAYSDLSGKPVLFDGTYGSLTGVPATFVPSAHTHPASAISDSTTLGRALLLAATAAGARADLGLGSAALEDIADGSGVNGYYFEIGPILVCWHTIALGSILAAGSGTDASPYRTGLASWTFPQTFSANPFFSISFTPDSAIAIDARPMVPGPTSVSTTTLFNIRAHRQSSSNAATDVTAHVFAWGLA